MEPTTALIAALAVSGVTNVALWGILIWQQLRWANVLIAEKAPVYTQISQAQRDQLVDIGTDDEEYPDGM